MVVLCFVQHNELALWEHIENLLRSLVDDEVCLVEYDVLQIVVLDDVCSRAVVASVNHQRILSVDGHRCVVFFFV